MVNTIKEVFDSKYFHGRLTDEEAYNLCKEELTNNDKPLVYIYYLLEAHGRLQGKICGYRRDSEVPLDRLVDVQKFEVFQNPGQRFNTVVKIYNSIGIVLIIESIRHVFVERKNPHQLLELARVATLDNCNGYCCLRSLIEKIDELRIPASEKEELKKLARGFHLILEENLPNELCVHN